jgi:class 3 adenylate cyclase
MSDRRERKVISVVFADLVGFTARSQHLDPEDVEAFLRPYHEQLRAEFESFGGTVEKFIGDAVVAIFGAPIAHEDDPERAVRAALAIRDRVADAGNLEVRIAVTTGEAVVRLDATPERGEGIATGDVLSTASRLQNAAPVNGILVDARTHEATRAAIRYSDAPPVDAKGRDEPVPVWLAIEPLARFGIDVQQTSWTPLVGRDGYYMLEGAYSHRALILLARGEDDRPSEAIRASLAIARASGDPQQKLPALATAAYIHLVLGAEPAAREFAEELLAIPKQQFRIIVNALSAPQVVAMTRLGLGKPYADRFAGGRETPWVTAARHAANGDWVAAAELFARWTFPPAKRSRDSKPPAIWLWPAGVTRLMCSSSARCRSFASSARSGTSPKPKGFCRPLREPDNSRRIGFTAASASRCNTCRAPGIW